MEKLFADMRAKEDEAKRKIDQQNCSVNLEELLASQKKAEESFASTFSKDISELIKVKIDKIVAEKDEEIEIQNEVIEQMKDVHARMESILKENIIQFKTLINDETRKKERIFKSIVSSKPMGKIYYSKE